MLEIAAGPSAGLANASQLTANIRHQEHWRLTQVVGKAHVLWQGPVLAAWLG